MDLGLKGKVAMVAGASRGLGFAVAKTLASEGAIVSMASRDRDAIAKASARVQEEVGGTTIGCVAGCLFGRKHRNVASKDSRTLRWHRSTGYKLWRAATGKGEFIRRCRLAERIRANFAQHGSDGPSCGALND